jgi:chromosome segregation ATPase
MTAELTRVLGEQGAHRRELEDLRTQVASLTKDLEKMTTQKTYVADAFEQSRKENSRLKTENQLQNEELMRLRSAVETLQAERLASSVGRTAIEKDLCALEFENDQLHRALGTATKQLFSKQRSEQQDGGSAKPRVPSSGKKGKPAAKALSSPHGSASAHPTGGRPRSSQGSGRALPW